MNRRDVNSDDDAFEAIAYAACLPLLLLSVALVVAAGLLGAFGARTCP